MSDIENDSDSQRKDDHQFVKVVEGENTDEFVELPAESDDTILISTLQGQFPNAIGLRYKSGSGGWRGVRISGDILNPPNGGWGDTVYFVTVAKDTGSKRKIEDTVIKKENDVPKKLKAESGKPSESHLLQDMIVLGLPYSCKDIDLKEYFTSSCGELSLYEVKYDRQTKKARGFGFIRFKTVDGAKAALNGEHSIMGRTVEIRLSKKKEEPIKLFVGRIPDGTSADELKTHFNGFGDVDDAYIPTPFRGFGFVTYLSSEDGRAALRRSHEINGVRLNVQLAEPKEEKMARRRREEDAQYSQDFGRSGVNHDDYQRDTRDSQGWNGGDRTREMRGMRDNGRYNGYNARVQDYRSQYSDRNSRDTASELKNMLFSLLSGGNGGR